MYLAKTLTPSSLPDIGTQFDRDHTTIMHAVKTIENLLPRDEQLRADVAFLTRRLKEG
jgi:chromosomal replication initiator protein